MAIEFIGQKIFHQEIQDSGELWVARSEHKNIFAMELDRTGYSLPVWSNSERVMDYLKNARPIGPAYQPYRVSLKVFSEAWLANKSMAINELLINPDGKSSRMLALYPEEFQQEVQTAH